MVAKICFGKKRKFTEPAGVRTWKANIGSAWIFGVQFATKRTVNPFLRDDKYRF